MPLWTPKEDDHRKRWNSYYTQTLEPGELGTAEQRLHMLGMYFERRVEGRTLGLLR